MLSCQVGNTYICCRDSCCYGHRWSLTLRQSVLSCQVGNTYICCHDSCCYGHRWSLTLRQSVLSCQVGNTYICCHDSCCYGHRWSLTLRRSVLSRQDGNTYVCCHDSCCYGHRVELNTEAREKDGELYCLRCHDKMGIPICGACRRPIDERVVHALGKTWHVEVSWSVHLSVCSTLVSVCLDCVCVCHLM